MKQGKRKNQFNKTVQSYTKTDNTIKKETVEKQKENVSKTGKEDIKVRRYPKLQFALKFAVIIAIALGVVRYTDKKGIFNPKLDFRDTFVRTSLEQLTQKDTIDVCLFGNSHVGLAISANILSNSLGCTCFNYFQHASDLQGVYFSMLEVLKNSPIKVAVIETYSMTSARQKEIEELGGKHPIPQLRIMSPSTRLKAMFEMVPLELYPETWSSTLRNHDFIFRDTARINLNKKGIQYKAPTNIYLGSTSKNCAVIGDSLDKVYDAQGAIMDGNTVGYDEFDNEYLDKIINLCKEKNIKLVFLTIPEYQRNIKNYKHWKSVTASLIKKTNAPWLDLQANYDTTKIHREYFENVRNINQHATGNGVPYFSTMLAAFLKDSCKLNLPNRSKDKHWNDMFYGSDAYYFNYCPRDTDKVFKNICNDKVLGNIKLKNSFYAIQEQSNNMFIKFEKNKVFTDKNKIKVIVKGKFKGNDTDAVIEFNKLGGYEPVNYDIYVMGLVKEFIPKDIVAVAF